MGYDDLKVIEAERFLSSIADGRRRPVTIREAVAAMRVVGAIDRSCATGRWEKVEEPKPSPPPDPRAATGERRMGGDG